MILQKRKFRPEALSLYLLILGAGAAFFTVQFFNAVAGVLARAIGTRNDDLLIVLSMAACCGCFFAVLGTALFVGKLREKSAVRIKTAESERKAE
jgi:uncharacterized membrane protein